MTAMDSNSTAGLLPGQDAPLAVVTATDQTGIIIITTAFAMVFALVSICIRIFIRMEFHHAFSVDDHFSIASMIFSIIQSAIVFVACHEGLGKTIQDVSSHDLLAIQKSSYASDIFYILTVWLTKCSVCFLFLRLTPDKKHTLTSYLILGASTLLMVLSIFIVALRCNLSHPWVFVGAKCTGLFARWHAVAAFDIITELALFATSIYIVYGLQLSISKKMIVVLAFGLRLSVIFPIAFRLHYIASYISSNDPTLHSVLYQVCTQIHINYAIVAATTPCLRPFMSALATNYGTPARNKSPKGTDYQSGKSGNFSMGKISKLGSKVTSGINHRMSHSQYDNNDDGSSDGMARNLPKTRWDIMQHQTSVVAGDQRSIGSHESKQMIINKNTEWLIEYGDNIS